MSFGRLRRRRAFCYNVAVALRVVQYGDPVLRQKGAKVVRFDAELEAFAREMIRTMIEGHGIGLASQQVGRALQLCVIDTQTPDADVDFNILFDQKEIPPSLLMPLVLINPVVKPIDKSRTIVYNEGCLSFGGGQPDGGIRADVRRPEAIRCDYQDLSGGSHTLICDGLLSRVIQHETDHLAGILFIDRMPRATVKRLWEQLEKMKIL